jgi:hypothetical protein
MRDATVFGERCGDVGDELLGMDVDVHPDGTATVSGRFQENGPLWRAILRAEAELLMADADAMAVGRYDARTPDQRRVDAFVLVAERLGAAANRMTKDEPSGHDPRGHRASHPRRRSA